jgi:hypothetical protein
MRVDRMVGCQVARLVRGDSVLVDLRFPLS